MKMKLAQQMAGKSIFSADEVKDILITDFSVEIWFRDNSVIRVTGERAYLAKRIYPNGFDRSA